MTRRDDPALASPAQPSPPGFASGRAEPVRAETASGCHDTRRRAGARATAVIVFVVLGGSALAVAMAVRSVGSGRRERPRGYEHRDPESAAGRQLIWSDLLSSGTARWPA